MGYSRTVSQGRGTKYTTTFLEFISRTFLKIKLKTVSSLSRMFCSGNDHASNTMHTNKALEILFHKLLDDNRIILPSFTRVKC